MKFKKMISLLCMSAMLLSIMVLPTEAAPLSEETGYSFLINDNFDTDLGGWRLSEAKEGFEGSLSLATEDGVSVMKLVASSSMNKDSGAKGEQTAVHRDMPRTLSYKEGSYIYIKTRIKHTNPMFRAFLKYNRPYNLSDVNPNEQGYNYYSLLCINANAMLTYKHGLAGGGVQDGLAELIKGSSNYPSDGVDLDNKWFDITIKFDGFNKTAYYTVVDETTGRTYVATGDLTSPVWQGAFKSLAFMFRTNNTECDTDTLYVDYVQVYETGTATAEFVNNRVYPDENIKLKLVTDMGSAKVAADAVSIIDSSGEPIDAQKSYDVEEKTFTVDPAINLTPGNTYKLKLNSESLSDVGITLTDSGEYTFSVRQFLPKAENVTISGRAIPGTVIVSDYDYIFPNDPDNIEGNSEYAWYICDTPNGQYQSIPGVTTKDLAVTEDIKEIVSGKYIKFSVVPVSEDGTRGEEAFWSNNIIIPEFAPVVDNLTIKEGTDKLYPKSFINATYYYSDANGDNETGSEIKWYISDNGSDNWTEADEKNVFYNGRTLLISDEDINKYIHFTVMPKNDALCESVGEIYTSQVYGPVTDMISITNKFVNGGIESGELSPWVIEPSHTADYKGITLVTEPEGIYSGSYAMCMHPRIDNVKDRFTQTVSLDANKVYIASGMIKSATTESYIAVEPYIWSGSAYRPYRDEEKTTADGEWKRSTLTFVPKSAGEFKLGWLSFNAMNAEVYLDDLYLGELMISDIDTNTLAPVTIPEGDDKITIPVTNGKIYNQFGETDGLTGQKAVVSVEAVPGVAVVDNKIVVDKYAVAGKVDVTVKCIPEFRYNVAADGEPAHYPELIPAQSEFIKTLELELVAHDDKIPRAENLKATGIVKTGSTLTANYDFYQVDGKDDLSTVKWMYSDTQNGVYDYIPGATGINYVVESQYADKFIKFEVTPKTTDGLKGSPVISSFLIKPQAPEASNLTVDGDFYTGGEVTGAYEYSDINGDLEGNSSYQWYISDSQYGEYVPIDGANGRKLTFTQEHSNKFIKFSVTPVSKAEPYGDKEFKSLPYSAPSVPKALNLQIKSSNGILEGSYDFYHVHNAREKESKYEWKVDGVTVSTQSSYVINFSGTKTVTFSVTPVASTNPSEGEKVSVSISVTGKSGNAGGGSSGGGGSAGGSGASGGSSSGVGITSVNDMKLPETEVQKPQEEQKPKSDITGHWGETYINNMASRGVMKADESGNFDPDKTVVRSEMITYLFDALKLEESEYSAEFSDVSDKDGYAGKLQTMINNGTIASYHEFRPSDGISREEMCKILYISLENAGKLKKAETNVLDTFTDKDLIADWAKDYVNTIFANKIMIGTSDTTFAPKENITRAQVATMLVRILAVMEGE